MGKGTRTFLYLLGIGLLVYQQVVSRSNTPAAEASESSRASVAKAGSAAAAAKKKTHLLRLPPINNEREEQVNVPQALHNTMVKTRMRFNLTGNELDALESSWSELRQDAQAESTSDGWLLTRVEPDSLFARLGFQESDLVLKQELEDRYKDRDPEILERLERILNYIAR